METLYRTYLSLPRFRDRDSCARPAVSLAWRQECKAVLGIDVRGAVQARPREGHIWLEMYSTDSERCMHCAASNFRRAVLCHVLDLLIPRQEPSVVAAAAIMNTSSRAASSPRLWSGSFRHHTFPLSIPSQTEIALLHSLVKVTSACIQLSLSSLSSCRR